MYGSSPEEIGPKLAELERTMAAHGYDVGKSFRPGLSREQIDRRTKDLPYRLPEELYRMYMWHDGSPDKGPLLFRDHRFMPLELALRPPHIEVARTYEFQPAFPFAWFEGSYLLVPFERYGVHPALELPVINLFEGRTIDYYSIPRMLDTAIEWIREGVTRPGAEHRADGKKELAIWRQHNPGIFERGSPDRID